MKKLIIAIVIIMTMGFAGHAQNKLDTFVNDWESGISSYSDLSLPVGALGGIIGDQDAPLGSGLLVLTALGAGYAVARKRSR